MKELKLNPAGLKVTENNFLDPKKVLDFHEKIKYGNAIDPVVIIEDPINANRYIVNGHHKSFAAYLAKIHEMSSILLETDQDVSQCQLGRARSLSTIDELLEDCRKGHASSAELGLEIVADYVILQKNIAA